MNWFAPALLDPCVSRIFTTSATIIATAIVLFSTLILIPIQQCANKYSAKLIKYFVRDSLVIISMTFLYLALFYNILLHLVATLYIHVVISAVLLCISFVFIALLIMKTVTVIDPSKFLFKKIVTDCKKTLNRELEKAEKTIRQQEASLEKIYKETPGYRNGDFPTREKYSVSASVIDSVRAKILPLKSISIQLVKSSDYDLFEHALKALRETITYYLIKRHEYKGTRDKMLLELYGDILDIEKVAIISANVHFTQILYSSIKDMAIATAGVKKSEYEKGYNHLSFSFCRILSDRAKRAVRDQDIERAYSSTLNLGRVAEEFAVKGFGHTVSQIAEQMWHIADSCRQYSRTETYHTVREFLAETFYALLCYRKLYPNPQEPYDQMIVIYSKMIQLSITFGRTISTMDPMLNSDPDIFKDRSLPTLIYGALFYSDNDTIVQQNLETTEKIISLIEQYHDKDGILSSTFTGHLYQIGLWLLAFVDKEITLQLTFRRDVYMPSKENRQKAIAILMQLIDYMTNSFITCSQNKQQHINGEELQVAYLSLLCLTVYLEDKHKLKTKECLVPKLEILHKRLNEPNIVLSQTMHKNFLIFIKTLHHIDIKDVIDKFTSTMERISKRDDNINTLYILYGLKRPLMFNDTLFRKFDYEIFSKQ